jgi:hypothetical protein
VQLPAVVFGGQDEAVIRVGQAVEEALGVVEEQLAFPSGGDIEDRAGDEGDGT